MKYFYKKCQRRILKELDIVKEMKNTKNLEELIKLLKGKQDYLKDKLKSLNDTKIKVL